MIISRLLPKSRLLAVARQNPRLVRNVSEPTYDAKGYAPRPPLANLSDNWFYYGAAAFAAYMYFVMSTPISEITPASHPSYQNEFSDKWYFLYDELDKYVRKNYEKLKKEREDPKSVMKKVFDAQQQKK